MKRNKRRDLNISPNNLIVPDWEKPIPKHEKIVSIVSAIVFAICLAVIIAFEKNRIILTEYLVTVFVLIMFITGYLSLVAPIAYLGNKILRSWHNAEAAKELLEKGYDLSEY